MAAKQAELLREAAARQKRQRTGEPSASSAGAEPSSPRLVPPDGPLDELVQQVLGARGSFHKLGLEPGTPPETVRKRYLALALRMHPDKGLHHQAQEAFTALEQAHSVAHTGVASA